MEGTGARPNLLLLLLLLIALFLTEHLCLCELSRWVALAPRGGLETRVAQ